MSHNKVKIKKSYILQKWDNFLEKNLPLLIEYAESHLRKLRGIKDYDNPNKLEDFSPVILNDSDDKHSATIKYAVDNPNILNLALTGPYGSGKSSILRTFECKHIGRYEFLNISLATFDKKTLETEKIEYNILKQLFYSVEHKKIPESRFKRIENHTEIWLKTILFSFWLFSIFYFFEIEFLENLKKTLHLDFNIKTFDFIYGCYLMLGTGILLHKVMNFILNFKLTKFKIKETDFENDQDKKTITFENEIDEILYFFERTQIEIVFIQDIDRFENKSEIFIKLREINNLINNYQPIKNKRKVTFIYAVSDDVFKESERVKFFDFIIPVIPIINYTSSSSKLIEKLQDDIKKEQLTKEFIEDVSLFLNDYRTIKSICNEFTLYKNILGKQLDNYDNLLAMMIYKNIEPTDFDKLNSNKGYVYNVIENSSELVKEKNEIFNTQIHDLNKKLEDVNNEKLKSVKELRMLYILRFFELVMTKNKQPVFGLYLKQTLCSIENLLTDEFFELFTKEPNITYYYNVSYTTSSGISFSQIEKGHDGQSYASRLEVIKNSEKDRLNQIRSELNNIQNKKQELNSKKLFELLDYNNSSAYFEKHTSKNQNINNYKLLNYLLSNGNINEDYNHLISYFHPGSITKVDNDFLISLLPSEKALSYNHKLKEISSLIKRIKPENYNRDAILNFSLVDYFIENKTPNKLNSIINVLNKGNENSIKFIDEYFDHTNENNKSEFFKTVFINWSELWNVIITKSQFTSERIETYLKYIFKYLDLKTIEKIDQQKKLSIYLSELENLDCFDSHEINIEVLKKFIENSRIEFENLEYNENHKTLFEFIYDKNKYTINEKMIELFIANFNQNKTNVENLKTANYTTIKNSAKPKLIKYIDDNLEEYIENVFLKLDNNSYESQENICLILNNEEINVKGEIIEKAKFSIEDLAKIEKLETQSLLIKNQKTDSTWKNLITYYKKSKEIDETIIEYLNLENNYNILSKTKIDDSDTNIKKSFTKDLIKCDISDESYSKITKNLPYYYGDGTAFKEISSSKMKLLIESKTISLSVVNYKMINEEFNDLLIFLLEKNASNFLKSIEDYILDSNIILRIVKSEDFNPQQKLLIIGRTTDDILTSNKNLLINLSEFLLNNKINKISSNLLIELLSNTASNKNKAELTNLYFSFIEVENLRPVIEKIEDFSKLLLGKHPKVDNTTYNQKLIKNLDGKLISKANFIDNNKRIELFPYTKSRI